METKEELLDYVTKAADAYKKTYEDIDDMKKVIKETIINTIASNKNILKYTIKGIKKAIIEYKAK